MIHLTVKPGRVTTQRHVELPNRGKTLTEKARRIADSARRGCRVSRGRGRTQIVWFGVLGSELPLPPFVDAVGVVDLLRAVHALADQESVLGEERAQSSSRRVTVGAPVFLPVPPCGGMSPAHYGGSPPCLEVPGSCAHLGLCDQDPGTSTVSTTLNKAWITLTGHPSSPVSAPGPPRVASRTAQNRIYHSHGVMLREPTNALAQHSPTCRQAP
jgi:hypothetical protein